MRLSTPAKSLLLLFVPVLLFGGCSSADDEPASRVPRASEYESSVPFSTAEPERYRADVVTRSGVTERKFTVARDGARRRIEYDVDHPGHRGVLLTDREYLIDFERKVFAIARTGGTPAVDSDFVMHVLNQRHFTEFEAAGAENGVQIYKAVIDASPASEIVLALDPATNLPIKQEFYSIDGDRRELTYSTVLQNISLNVD
ncbi:MAG TPA: hypothetical protein VJL58_07295, partial [Pyrinomonadaceae bacterium]|nr:hypothetical protein [Pyrinomonadaceae bacterium]